VFLDIYKLTAEQIEFTETETSGQSMKIWTLRDVAADPEGAVTQLRVARRQQAEFKRVASQLPMLRVTVVGSQPTVLKVDPVTSRPKNVYAPRFHKAQAETWFVIVAKGENELVSLQRFSPSRSREQNLTLRGEGDRVYVINDAMDVSYEVPLK
jgi:antiviral helicase SLH1